MVDIRVVQNQAFLTLSIPLSWQLLSNGELDTSHDIETAVIVALSTDALAQPDDVLPNPHSSDRRGWWGDVDADIIWGGWPIGSRLWLLRRSKITDFGSKEGATVIRVQDYIHEALMPFVQKKILTNFDLNVYRSPYNRQEIVAEVNLYRGIDIINMKFSVFFNVTSPPVVNNGTYVIFL